MRPWQLSQTSFAWWERRERAAQRLGGGTAISARGEEGVAAVVVVVVVVVARQMEKRKNMARRMRRGGMPKPSALQRLWAALMFSAAYLLGRGGGQEVRDDRPWLAKNMAWAHTLPAVPDPANHHALLCSRLVTSCPPPSGSGAAATNEPRRPSPRAPDSPFS